MKVTVLGAYHASGTAKKTGAEYDMSRLIVVKPVEEIANSNRILRGVGFETMEMELDPTVIDGMRGMSFPQKCELEIGHKTDSYRGLQAYVIGVEVEGGT
jgi:hypothetical protein